MMFGLVPFRSSDVDGRKDPWEMNGVFESFFKDSFLPSFYVNSGQMKVDIRENDKEYIVEADLPGIDKQDISLEFDQELLTIAVNRQEEVNEENEKFIRKERRSSSMRRSFSVDNVLTDQVTAKFENGVLTINLPKKEVVEAKSKKIEIA